MGTTWASVRGRTVGTYGGYVRWVRTLVRVRYGGTVRGYGTGVPYWGYGTGVTVQGYGMGDTVRGYGTGGTVRGYGTGVGRTGAVYPPYLFSGNVLLFPKCGANSATFWKWDRMSWKQVRWVHCTGTTYPRTVFGNSTTFRENRCGGLGTLYRYDVPPYRTAVPYPCTETANKRPFCWQKRVFACSFC